MQSESLQTNQPSLPGATPVPKIYLVMLLLVTLTLAATAFFAALEKSQLESLESAEFIPFEKAEASYRP